MQWALGEKKGWNAMVEVGKSIGLIFPTPYEVKILKMHHP